MKALPVLAKSQRLQREPGSERGMSAVEIANPVMPFPSKTSAFEKLGTHPEKVDRGSYEISLFADRNAFVWNTQ